MNASPANLHVLKPLTELAFTSSHGERKFPCAAGRLKWSADTYALSIKASLLRDDLDSISESVTLSVIAQHRSLSFVFPKGFVATFTHATVSPRRPATHHYRIEGIAKLMPDAQPAATANVAKAACLS